MVITNSYTHDYLNFELFNRINLNFKLIFEFKYSNKSNIKLFFFSQPQFFTFPKFLNFFIFSKTFISPKKSYFLQNPQNFFLLFFPKTFTSSKPHPNLFFISFKIFTSSQISKTFFFKFMSIIYII